MLKAGTKAPEFSGILDDGSEFHSRDLLGKQNLVLYFYPKDGTTGCTRQACSFRDNFGAITAKGAFLLGVSSDDEESHTAFREEHSLPFPLLADHGKKVIDAFDARGMFGLGTARVTYVIDREGIIRGAFRHDLLVGKHVPAVLGTLEAIESGAEPAKP